MPKIAYPCFGERTGQSAAVATAAGAVRIDSRSHHNSATSLIRRLLIPCDELSVAGDDSISSPLGLAMQLRTFLYALLYGPVNTITHF